MRIGYFADGPWSHQAIAKIAADKDMEIAFIVPRFDSQDPVLKQWAENLQVPFLLADNVNSADFIDRIASYECDVLVSMSFNQILKREILQLAPLGFINCHAGALPFYRGRNPLNWALINGETEFGITVHYIDEGIDTGDIILQKKYAISESDNYASLLEAAVTHCSDVLYQAMLQLKQGNVKPIKQSDIHPVGTYFCQRIVGDELLDFDKPAKEVFNFVRAITIPGPGARIWLAQQEYAVLTCELIANAPEYIAVIGQVVGRDNLGIKVKVRDSSVNITKMCKVVDGKLAEPFVPNFKLGTRFKRGA